MTLFNVKWGDSITSEHVRDFHVMVIDDIGQVVDRKPVRLEDDRVAFHLQTGMLDRPIN